VTVAEHNSELNLVFFDGVAKWGATCTILLTWKMFAPCTIGGSWKRGWSHLCSSPRHLPTLRRPEYPFRRA